MDFPSQDTFDPRFGRYYEGREVFSRFLLRRLLGVGGMGQVWLAEDRHLGEEVALKFTVSEVAGDTRAVADLRRVVSQTRELTHPHIVRTYDFHAEGNEAAVSMEYMPGKNLSEWQQETAHGFFEPQDILPWLRTLCEVMDYAHQQAGRTHRDLKPKNIMWDAERGMLKVADFDIGRRITDTVSRNTGKEPSGSFPYMSPQQLLGERSVAQDDIYSIGATLYELLTGTPPFFSGDVREQIRLIVPPSMSVRRRDNHHDGLIGNEGGQIPAALEKTVASCLSKAREKRPASGADLLAMLEVKSAPTSKPSKPKPSPASAKKPLLVITLCAVLAIVAWAATKGRDRSPSGPVGKAAQQREFQSERDKAKSAIELAKDAEEEVVNASKEAENQRLAQEQLRKDKEAADQRKALADRTNAAKDEVKRTASVTKSSPYVNTLGMKFVPVGIKTGGKQVLFSVWETRRKDYEAYATANTVKTGKWQSPGFAQTGEHPVTHVSYYDAIAFCQWLTKTERTNGTVGSNDEYRLPTDAEWSFAVGIGERENSSASPESKNMKLRVYPWGANWPPPKGAGNYDSYGKEKFSDDVYDITSPVGSFASNSYGLFDLGGNVSELCGTPFNGQSGNLVSRGGCWHGYLTGYVHEIALSSFRQPYGPDERNNHTGFRCVLVVSE